MAVDMAAVVCAAAEVAVSAVVEAVVSRRRLSRRWFPWRLAFHGGGFRGGGVAHPRRRLSRRATSSAAAAFARRASTVAAASLRISPRLSPAALPSTGVTSIGAFYAPAITATRTTMLSGPPLPGDLDLLRAAQDLPLSSLVRHHAIATTGEPNVLVSSEMKQAPDRAPVFSHDRNAGLLNPSP